MVWSCITWEGVGWIVDVGHHMDSSAYLEVLKDDLLRTMDCYGLDKSDIVFQHDNDPKHTVGGLIVPVFHYFRFASYQGRQYGAY
ncbi:hypothetical protein G6F67_009066 [Rhizopus microsporus]|nr:hypothetical protein G6F67_009066 [Rhizopus microsporus]